MTTLEEASNNRLYGHGDGNTYGFRPCNSCMESEDLNPKLCEPCAHNLRLLQRMGTNASDERTERLRYQAEYRLVTHRNEALRGVVSSLLEAVRQATLER